MDIVELLLNHDLWLTRQFLEKARSLWDAELDRPLPVLDNSLLYLWEDKRLRELLHRLIFTKEVWMASIHGRQMPKDLDKSIAGCPVGHVLTFSAYRRTATIEVFGQFGITGFDHGDPIVVRRMQAEE